MKIKMVGKNDNGKKRQPKKCSTENWATGKLGNKNGPVGKKGNKK